MIGARQYQPGVRLLVAVAFDAHIVRSMMSRAVSTPSDRVRVLFSHEVLQTCVQSPYHQHLAQRETRDAR